LIQAGLFLSVPVSSFTSLWRHILLQNQILRLEKQKLLDKEKQLRESENAVPGDIRPGYRGHTAGTYRRIHRLGFHRTGQWSTTCLKG
jgi:hypothetical protein